MLYFNFFFLVRGVLPFHLYRSPTTTRPEKTNRLGGKYQTSLSFNVALEEGRDTDQEERERERERG